jgi:hypothetical protein
MFDSETECVFTVGTKTYVMWEAAVDVQIQS